MRYVSLAACAGGYIRAEVLNQVCKCFVIRVVFREEVHGKTACLAWADAGEAGEMGDEFFEGIHA